MFFGLAILLVGIFTQKSISFVLLFSVVFSVFEFLRGNLFTGFPWNLIAYTWSWSNETIQVLSLIGTYSLSLISITFFCIPFLFFQKKIIKKNILFLLFFLIIFICNYSYGKFKLNYNYNYDDEIKVKIISPNFSLEDYQNETEEFQLRRLIKISNPREDEKTLFIWPEGIFYESSLEDIKKHENLFKKQFS